VLPCVTGMAGAHHHAHPLDDMGCEGVLQMLPISSSQVARIIGVSNPAQPY
jgi:hypothetical protein